MMKQVISSWAAAALVVTAWGCGGDDKGSPNPGAAAAGGGGPGGNGSPTGSVDDDLEDCRADLPEWSTERELTVDGGGLSHFTIVDGRVYYAAGTEFYGDGFPAADAAPEVLLRSYPSVNYFVTPGYVGYGSGTVPMQRITLIPRAGGASVDRPIEAKVWATQGQYHAGTDSIYGRVSGDENYRYFVHEVASGEERIVETTSPAELQGATLVGEYLYATRVREGQPRELLRFALGGTEAEPVPVPVDVGDFGILAKDSRSLYLRAREGGDNVNRYYRLAPAGGAAESIDFGDEGLEGVFATPRGLIFNTQESPGQPVNVRLLPEDGTEPVELWSTTFECRSRGMLIDGANLHVGLQPNVRNWIVTIPLASLGL